MHNVTMNTSIIWTAPSAVGTADAKIFLVKEDLTSNILHNDKGFTYSTVCYTVFDPWWGIVA